MIDDASCELAATQNELPRDAMNDHIPGVHAEIEQRLAAILVADENRGQISVRNELQPRVDTVIGGGCGFERGIAAIPIVDIAGPLRGGALERGIDALRRLFGAFLIVTAVQIAWRVRRS